MATKQTCKNHQSFTYSGKEMSPLGLGYTAEAEEVGTVMEGRDKTMWMVGIKNGVRVWNRIPTQVAATVIPPLTKEAPLAEKKEEIAPAPKKAPPKKKAAPVVEEKKEEVKIEENPKVEKEEPAPAPAPKKAPPRKKVAVAAPEVDDTKEEIAPAPKKAPPKKKDAVEDKEAKKEKKPPTAFNMFMSYRMDQLKTSNPEMDHKQRFVKATSDWKELSDDEKKNMLAAAKEWHAKKN